MLHCQSGEVERRSPMAGESTLSARFVRSSRLAFTHPGMDISTRRRFSFSIEKTAWIQLLRGGAAIWAAITNIENASKTTMTTPTPCSLPQDLVHRLSLGQFIHQLVQVTDLLHEL